MAPSSPPLSGSSKKLLLHRAQLIARLRHPNLVRVIPLPGGAGLTPVLGNARCLADFISPSQSFKRFELQQVLSLLLDVLNGLGALHEVDVDGAPFVHGEVSPQHIYVSEHGNALLVPLVNAHLMPSAKLESNGYIAPERLLGDAADARCDLFSVGVMLWEALAGRPLFPEVAADAVLTRAIGGKVPRLVPPVGAPWAEPLCRIAERAISVDPTLRFETAAAFGRAIVQAAGRRLSDLRERSWQDEAPTPVFQPRVHLAPLRRATPPATVVDLEPAPPAMADVPVVAVDALPEVTHPQVEADDVPLQAEWSRARRGRGLLVGLASVGVAAICWVMAVPPPSERRPAAALESLQPPRASASAPRAAAMVVVPASAAAHAPAAAVAPAPAPSSSASTATPAPVSAPVHTPPRRARPAKRPAPARADVDYGI